MYALVYKSFHIKQSSIHSIHRSGRIGGSAIEIDRLKGKMLEAFAINQNFISLR